MTKNEALHNEPIADEEQAAPLDDLALSLRLLEGLGHTPQSTGATSTPAASQPGESPALQRLRLCPSLWEALHSPPCLEAVVPVLAGRPVDWALACLAAVALPQTATDSQPIDSWLQVEGAPLREWALGRLPTEALPAHPQEIARRWTFIQPLALAYALQASEPWPETVDQHGAALDMHPEAVIFLAGLVDPAGPLLAALLAAGRAELAARALAANVPAEQAAARAREMQFPPVLQLSLCQALTALGFEQHATAVALTEPAPSEPVFRADHIGGKGAALAEALNRALLSAQRGERAQAQEMLAGAQAVSAWLTGAIAAALADMARDTDLASAERAIKQAIDTNPEEHQYRVQLAAIQLADSRPDEALKTLAPALGDRPDAWANLTAARAHLALGDARAAARHARSALQTLSTSEEALTASQILARAGDLKAAIASAERATALTPWDSAAWVSLAERHLAAADAHGAAAAYAQAAALTPHLPQVRAALAECLAALGRRDEAERQFHGAGALAPGDSRVAAGLARLALDEGDAERAVHITQEALAAANGRESGVLHDILGAALEALDKAGDASEHYAEATRLAPSLSHPWLRLAAHQRANRQHSQARETLEAAAKAVPKDTRILSALAELYTAAGEHHLARDTLARALTLAPADGRLLTRYGAVLRTLGEFHEALSVLQAAADNAKGERRADALHEMALAYHATGEHEAALAAAQLAVASRPDHAPYQAALGSIALAAHRPDIAVDALSTAIAASDATPDLYNQLGRAYRALGEPHRAMEVHMLALRMQPDNLDYQFDFALAARDDGQHAPAAVALREVVAARPEDAEAWLALGLSQEALVCWKDAAAALTTAARLLPDRPEPHQALGRVYMHLNESGPAITALGRALSLAPDDIESYHLLGDAYAALGRVEQAVQAYHQALDRSPDDGVLHNAVGTALLNLEAYAEALPVLERAHALAPEDASVCNALSRVYETLGRHEAALDAARTAVTLAPEHAPYHAALGRLQLDDDAQAAADEWAAALALDPDDVTTRWQLIDLYDRLKQPAMALEAVLPLLAEQCTDTALLQRATRWALAAGDTHRAGHLIALALSCDGTDPELHALAAEVSVASGEMMNALTSLRYAIELAPRKPAFHIRIAELLLDQNRPADALVEAEQAASLGVETTEDLLALGRLFNRTQRWSSALPLLMQVVEHRRDDPAAWLELAQARIALTVRAVQLAEAGVARERLPTRDLQATLRVIEQAISLGADGPTARVLHGQAYSLLGEHERALALLKEAYEAAPNSMTRLALGEAYLSAGDLDAAERHLEPASDQLHLEPNRLLALGLLYMKQGNPQSAYTVLKQATSHSVGAPAAPSNAVVHYHLAQAASALNKHEAAVEALTQAAVLVPRVPPWHHQLGVLLLEMGRSHDAVEQLDQAVTLAPEQPEFLVSLGRALRVAGDLEGAVERYEEALRIIPERAAWWAELGALHEALEADAQLTHATECYRRALKLDENHIPALLGLARTSEATGAIDDALDYAQRAADIAPEDADAIFTLAVCTARSGNVDEAAWLYERAAGLSPAPGPILLTLGHLYSGTGQWPKAIDALRRSVEAQPDDEAFAALALALERVGEQKAAIDAARQAVELAPDDPDHWQYLGILYRRLGDTERALECLNRAAALAPTDAKTIREIGLVHESCGQYTKALESYQQAIHIAPEQAESHFHAGLVLKQVKDYRNAIQMFKQATRLDPQNTEAQKQLAAVSALAFVTQPSR